MVKANDPLEFIRANLREAPPAIDAQKVSDDTAKKIAEAPKPEVAPEPLEATPALPPASQEDSSGEDAPEVEVTSEDKIKLNFSKLRGTLKETKKTLQTKAQEAEELKSKVEKYETGEIIPEVLKEKESEIQRLSYYEKLHNLKFSKEYKEAYIKPLDDLRGKVNEIAKDYNIPEDVMEEALNLTDRRELNQFLSSHFDDVDTLQVKSLITDMQAVKAKAKEAEGEPAKAFKALQEEHQKIEEIKSATTRNKIADTAQNGWHKSLMGIRKEGKILELIRRESDSEFNTKVVDPILSAASSEYGKMVRLLADSGLVDLSDEIADALAKTVLLAHASAISIETRNRAMKEAEDLRTNTQRNNPYMRPNVGGGTGSTSNPSEKQPSSTKEAASSLLQKVMGQR